MQGRTKLGEAYVAVTADASEIGKALDAKMRAAARKIAQAFSRELASIGRDAARAGERAGDAMGDELANGIRRGVRDGIDGAPVEAPATRSGNTAGGAFARGFKKRVEAAMKALPEIRIDADSSEADRQLSLVRAQLAGLGRATIGVDISSAEARRELELLTGKLRDLDADGVDVTVRSDIRRALSELGVIQAEVDRLDGRTANVDVRVDDHGSTMKLRGSVAGLLAAAIAVAPALVPIGAAAVGALGGIASVAGSAAGAVGVLALGFYGVADAVGFLGDRQDAAAEAAISSAASQVTSANAIASAQRGLASAQASLANTTINAAEQRAQAAQAVEDAETSAARAIDQALQRLATAERRVGDAQKGTLQAQLDLTAAREAAQRQIEDTAAAVESNALDQRQAILDVAEAQAALDKALADPKATEAQQEQAKITFAQQVARQKELGRAGDRLADQQAKQAEQGVDGAQQVVDASQRLADARQDEIDAVVAVGEATAAVDQARIDGTKQVADAVAAQASANRQAAFSIQQAQDAVIGAQAALQQALASTGDAGTSSLRRIDRELAAMPASVVAFAGYIRSDLMPVFDQLRGAAADNLLPGVQAGLEAMMPLVPSLTAFVASLASTMGDLFTRAGQALTSPFWVSFFDYIMATAGPTLETVATIVGNVAEGLAGLMMAFQPVADQIGAGLERLTGRFADFGRGASENPGFQRFIEYVQENGPRIMDVLGRVADALINVVESMANFGPASLEGIGILADVIAMIDPDILSALAVAIGVVTSVVWLITSAIAAWDFVQAILTSELVASTAAAWGLTAVPVVAIFVGIIAAVAAVIAGIVLLVKNWDTVTAAIGAAWDWLAALFTRVYNDYIAPVFAWFAEKALWLWENAIQPALSFITDAWNTLASVVMSVWNGFIKPVFELWGAIVSWLWSAVLSGTFAAISGAWNLLASGFQWVWTNLLKPVFDGWAAIFGWLWTNALQPVMSAISAGWDGLMRGMSWVWTNVLKPVFDFISGTAVPGIKSAFDTAVSGIRTVWDGLMDIAKAPIRFVVNTVLNDGLISAFNWVADFFGTTKISKINLPAGFAEGGLIRGPGTGTSDSILGVAPNGVPTSRVSAGEFVVKEKRTRIMRPLLEFLNGASDAAVQRVLPAFASGGVVGGRPGGRRPLPPDSGGWFDSAVSWVSDRVSDVVDFGKSVTEWASDPVGKLKSVVQGLFGNLLDNPVGRLVADGATAAVDWAKTKLTNLFGGGGEQLSGAKPITGTGPVSGPPSVQRIFSIVKAQFPQARLNSGYRPGDPGYHGRGLAVDLGLMGVAGGNGNTYMASMNQWLADTYPGSAELIYDGLGDNRPDRKNGVAHTYNSATQAQHRNHVHWVPPQSVINTFDGGGWLEDGMFGINSSGSPEPVFSTSQWDVLERNVQPILQAADPARGASSTTVMYAPQITVPKAATAREVAAIVSNDLVRNLRLGLPGVAVQEED